MMSLNGRGAPGVAAAAPAAGGVAAMATTGAGAGAGVGTGNGSGPGTGACANASEVNVASTAATSVFRTSGENDERGAVKDECMSELSLLVFCGDVSSVPSTGAYLRCSSVNRSIGWHHAFATAYGFGFNNRTMR